MNKQIIGSATLFMVPDVVKTANYYRDHLQFTYERFWGDPPAFCILSRDDFSIMLSGLKDGQSAMPNSSVQKNTWDAYFWVKDVDQLYEEFRSKDVKFLYTPELQEYGVKEMTIEDMNGYLIAWGQVMN